MSPAKETKRPSEEDKQTAAEESRETVSVTREGRTEVDIPRLLRKDHVQKMLREVQEKTEIITRKE